ncbi:MAG: branched-chain amino acid ABC transporter permease [Acetobacteraceae bacterium]|nr:branched-chain amino acid ABC transporter permease [Acetobacteraceae bacterium]
MVETPRQVVVLLASFAVMAGLPAIAAAAGRPDFVTLGSQVCIMAIAAAGLDLLMGRTGLPSFGQAAWFGLGGYTVAILAAHAGDGSLPGWVTGAWFAWPAAILVPAVLALGIGALCLRTTGISFIMITLAFAQMFFFLFVALKAYGGDDGLSMRRRNALPFIGPRDDVGFYYVCLAALVLVLLVLRRVWRSRLGVVLDGIRQNERRMLAIGLNPFPYKLAAFVLAASLGGLAGALHVNLFRFASPDLLHWTQSGELMVMVVLGGLGSLWGAVFGAAALVLLHVFLAQWTEHWMIVLGPILVAVVLLARRGVWGALGGR